MRCWKSTSRGPTKTGWVWESTNPGRMTLPAQSISVTLLRFFFSQGSRRASLVVPTETIFPPRQRRAPFSMMPSCFRSEMRRGPGLPDEDRSVSNWLMLASKIADPLRTRHLHATLLRKLLRLVISRVDVADYAHARICRQHALDAFRHRICAVGYCDLAGVEGVADAYAAAVVD